MLKHRTSNCERCEPELFNGNLSPCGSRLLASYGSRGSELLLLERVEPLAG